MATKTRAKKRPKVETYEDFFKAALSRYHEAEVLRDLLPTTYPFEVGEEVIIGHLPDARVEGLLYGGRLVHVSYHDKGERYGIPFDNQRRLVWVGWWMSVSPKKLEGDSHFSQVPSYLRASYSANSISGLLSRTYRLGLLDTPDYQRDYVWSLRDKQNLIGSVFNGFDIGKFVFLEYEHPEWRLEIIDGKQRIRALREFWEGRFDYKGKTFFELSGADKYAFSELQVQYATMNAANLKKSDLLWLFLSINRGGVPQTEAHIARVQKMYEEQLALEATHATA